MVEKQFSSGKFDVEEREKQAPVGVSLSRIQKLEKDVREARDIKKEGEGGVHAHVHVRALAEARKRWMDNGTV